MHRHGTWPARLFRSSSASRAKRHSGARPSAQTLGLGRAMPSIRSCPSNQARCKVSQLNAAHSAASWWHRVSFGGLCSIGTLMSRRLRKNASACVSAIVSQWFLRPRMSGSLRRRPAGAGGRAPTLAAPPRQSVFPPDPRPNPSLEWTCTGMALGPRGCSGHHPPRGPSAIPARAPQLKR